MRLLDADFWSLEATPMHSQRLNRTASKTYKKKRQVKDIRRLPGLQRCHDARLADGDALLLHRLVDRCPILLVHLRTCAFCRRVAQFVRLIVLRDTKPSRGAVNPNPHGTSTTVSLRTAYCVLCSASYGAVVKTRADRSTQEKGMEKANTKAEKQSELLKEYRDRGEVAITQLSSYTVEETPYIIVCTQLYLVELVDEAHALVREHQRPAFQCPFLRQRVLVHTGCETHSRCTFSGCIHRPRSGLLAIL